MSPGLALGRGRQLLRVLGGQERPAIQGRPPAGNRPKGRNWSWSCAMGGGYGGPSSGIVGGRYGGPSTWLPRPTKSEETGSLSVSEGGGGGYEDRYVRTPQEEPAQEGSGDIMTVLSGWWNGVKDLARRISRVYTTIAAIISDVVTHAPVILAMMVTAVPSIVAGVCKLAIYGRSLLDVFIEGTSAMLIMGWAALWGLSYTPKDLGVPMPWGEAEFGLTHGVNTFRLGDLVGTSLGYVLEQQFEAVEPFIIGNLPPGEAEEDLTYFNRMGELLLDAVEEMGLSGADLSNQDIARMLIIGWATIPPGVGICRDMVISVC